MSTSALYRRTATEVVSLLKKGEVTPLELVDVAADRIAATDGAINAMPTLCLERARDHAKRLMASGEKTLLGGLPIAVKDLNEVEGVRCTHGSPIFADHIPERSDLMVEALEARGAIVVGKSNTPEFGAGASTFNEVLGKTRNPWNTGKSVAGSSGGAAAALAAGQVWLATGSDLGGSLRTPASFNSVIGLRPSPGRVPHGPSDQAFNTMSVNGPMARTVADTALFLDAMTGQTPEDPISLAAPATSFVDAVAACPAPRRVAFSPNLGIVSVDREVIAICERAARHFADAGAEVVDACPDFSEAIEAFQVIRAQSFATGMEGHLRDNRDLLKPEVIWNIEKGLALSAAEIAWAELARGRLYHSTVKFFAENDLLLCPAAIVPPFDVDIRYIDEVEGEKFDNYVHWISITFAVTLTSCPAISAPAGFTESGLPVGLQIVGPPRGEVQTLAAAALLEQATGIASQLPIDPRESAS
jgi:amidase